MNQKKPGLHVCDALDAVDFYFYSDLRHRLRPSIRALERAFKRPRGEHADEVSFVFGRPSDVVNRLGLPGRNLGRLFDCGVVKRLASQEGFGPLRLQRNETDVSQADPRALADARAVHDDLSGDARRRVVADLPLDL